MTAVVMRGIRSLGLAEWALLLALAAIVLIIAAIFVFGGDSFQSWAVWCGEQGGRVIDQHSTGVGYSSSGSGGVVVTSNTTYFCLSPEGGILDAR